MCRVKSLCEIGGGAAPCTPGVFKPDDAGLVSRDSFGLAGGIGAAGFITVVAGEPYDGPGDIIIVRAPYAAPFLL